MTNRDHLQYKETTIYIFTNVSQKIDLRYKIVNFQRHITVSDLAQQIVIHI